MNNAVYGKTMENVRNRVNIKLLRENEQQKELLTSIAKPTYKRSVPFDNGVVAVEFQRTQVKLNKPIYVGTTVLDLSKELMYSFFYDVLYARYGDRVRLLYTDTDSLILLVETEDLVADMAESISQYDTSNYPVDHVLYSNVNKKVVGKFKDELGGQPIKEFVGLRSKMYAYHCEDGTVGKRAKGVQSSVLNSIAMGFEHYRQQLALEASGKVCEMQMLRSRQHHVHQECVNKVALSGFDTKRYILENGVDTLAYGHVSLQ